MLGMDKLKNTVVRQLGAEEYEIVTQLMNGQLERLEEALTISGIDHEKAQRFDPEKLEEAIQKAGVDETLGTVLRQFDQRMKKLEAEIMLNNDVDPEEIRRFLSDE